MQRNHILLLKLCLAFTSAAGGGKIFAPHSKGAVRLSKLSAAVLASLGAAPAMANIQPYFSPVPISADALAADPSLANFNCWDLRVSVTGMSPTAQERFTVATLY